MSFEFWECWTHLASLWLTQATGGASPALVASRLEALVRHARAGSPFYAALYRDLPAAGPIELARLPRVDKPTLMSRFDDWATDRAVRRKGVERFLETSPAGALYLGRYSVWKSSGTTGVPGIFVQDAHALTVYDALVAAQFGALPWTPAGLARLAAGAGRCALVTAIGGHFAGIDSWEHLRRAYPHAPSRTFSVTEPTARVVAGLNALRPSMVAGYPSVLAILAGERRAGRLRIEPAMLWSGGEHLSAATRAAIEHAFDCPLVNEYGASECLSIGHECVHGSIHANSDWVILEGVDERGRPVAPGATSHTTLLTNLANHLQPVIRYDLGDRITPLAGCACGSAQPAFRVEGRRDDTVVLRARGGGAVPLAPMALATIVEEASGLHRFQVAQTAPDALALRVAPRGTPAGRVATAALRAFLARQGLGHVRVTLAREAPRADAGSGKLQTVVVDRTHFP